MNPLNFLACLAAFLTFTVLSTANPLNVRTGGVLTVAKDGPPAGYTFGKLTYHTHCHAQVKAQYPEFQLPVHNATKFNELKAAATKAHTTLATASGVDRRSPVFGGDGWHAYCNPVPGQPWLLANEMNLDYTLYFWQGVISEYYTINGMTCALWDCNLGAGWTVCNGGGDTQTLTEDSMTYYPFILINSCGSFFKDFKPANGGQIFWESANLNYIAAGNWNGCWGETFM
ncbi:uncharacterized protein LY89DRAFT_740111 [Mollisia scopiformis]|uniref:Uncharacterized protein n=1 Tax=Mollisia scopiformis TaxID=149040 RepID=A0A132BEV5_MOLSC|nr:uncharacterized protein LY89DRAFT_740111 [Mollisia scopiformis]KUJ10394.1 hypothetical protein LY89DRAFT_740111 [Mollisia scopiformis]